MRIIKSIPNVSVKTKKLSATLFEYADYSTGVTSSGKGYYLKGSSEFIPLEYNPVKFYDLEEKKFVYCADGYLYSLTKNGLSKFSLEKFDSPPQVFTVKRKGKTALVVASGNTAILHGEKACVSKVLCLENYTCYKGRAFAVKNSRLYFGSFESGKVFDADYITDSYVIINSSYGQLIRTVIFGESLYLFAEYGILKISVGTGKLDVTVRPVLRLNSKIDGESIVGTSDGVYFISDKQLYKFWGEKVLEVTCTIGEREFSLGGGACIANGAYIIPINVFGGQYFYLYDIIKKEECFICANDLLILKDGTAIDKGSGEIKMLAVGFEKWSVVMKETDFGVDGIKTLNSLEIKTDVPVTLTISGGGINKIYSLMASTKVYPNMRSEYFSVSVDGEKPVKGVKKVIYNFKV